MKIFIFLACILSINYGVRGDDGPQCKAPNGEGLQSVVEEFYHLLPHKQLISIFMKAVSKDQEVQNVMEYLSSKEFEQLVVIIQNTPEFVELMEFTCKNLYFDMYYYFNKIGGFLGLPPVTRPPSRLLKRSADAARPGFHGMLLDMIDVIPVDKLKTLFENKLKTDKYVQLAVETMKGDKFKAIIHTLREQEQYKKMIENLRQMGVKVDEILDFVRKFFGW